MYMMSTLSHKHPCVLLVAPISRQLCVGLLLVHGSLLLGYQPITNHNTTGGEIGATKWRTATHRDPCALCTLHMAL